MILALSVTEPVNDQSRNVIMPPGFIGGGNERLAGGMRVGLGLQDGSDVSVGYHIGQAVRAEQNAVGFFQSKRTDM